MTVSQARIGSNSSRNPQEGDSARGATSNEWRSRINAAQPSNGSPAQPMVIDESFVVQNIQSNVSHPIAEYSFRKPRSMGVELKCVAVRNETDDSGT